MQLKNTLEGSTLDFDQGIPVLYFNKSQRPLRIRFYQFFKGFSVISTAMEKALFEQLNHEFYSAYLYLAMSAYCSHIEFNGAASWLKLQYEEEHMHATKIYNLLQWFVNEQVEEEASVGGIISELKMVKDDGYGRLMIDNELGSRSAPKSIV
jgi:ferritin